MTHKFLSKTMLLLCLFLANHIFAHTTKKKPALLLMKAIPANFYALNHYYEQKMLSPNQLLLDASFYTHSNCINTQLVASFLTGTGFSKSSISNAKKWAANSIKYEDQLRAGIAYKHHFKKADFDFSVSYYHRNMRFLFATKDAFRLAFEGNTPYINQTANLDNLYFENLMYNQYSIGFGKKFDKLSAYANLSFLQGFSNQQLYNYQGSLYTAPYGEYLDAKYNFQFNQSNTQSARFFAPNGLGYSLDLGMAYTSEKIKIALDVQDLGAILWTKNTRNFAADTAVHYEGVYVDLAKVTSGNFGVNLDSIAHSLAVKKSQDKYTTILPASVQLTLSKKINASGKTPVVLNFGLKAKRLKQYYAYLYFQPNVFLNHGWVVSPSVGVGGYSSFNLGLEVGKFSKHFDFLLGSENLLGTAVPMYYPGMSAYLKLVGKF